MRVIAGAFRGRRLFSPKDRRIRPTSDRLRETIFNILAHRVVDRHVLDLFAGTGALGIEALSRGAASCTFVDSSQAALALIKRNLDHLHVPQRTHLLRWDLKRTLSCLSARPHPFDLVFLDPPYGRGLLLSTLEHLAASESLAVPTLLVVEHDIREAISEGDLQHGYRLADQRSQRKSLVSFLQYML